MATTIGEAISRVRNQIKAVKQDAFITDRFLFSLISKHAHWLMKREDSKNRLMRFASVIQTIDFIELIEVDTVEAHCSVLNLIVQLNVQNYKCLHLCKDTMAH